MIKINREKVKIIMKLFKGMEALFLKADNTEQRYEDALEKKQVELIELQGKLQHQLIMLKDLHKMKLLGDVSEETYQAEDEKVEKLQKHVQELQKEIQLIEVYKTEDIQAIIEELDVERSKAFGKHQVEIQKIKMELLEAKLNYLKKQTEARERYNELVTPERNLDQLKIKLGIKKVSYVSDSFEALSMVSVPNGGVENMIVQLNEVNEALRYGRTPEQLSKMVQDAIDKGIIN